MNRTAIAITAALLATGCWGGYAKVRSEHQTAVRKRAAFDFSCPEERISVEPLPSSSQTPRQYGAEGCGDRAVYINVAEPDWDTPGIWVLDSDTRAGVD